VEEVASTKDCGGAETVTSSDEYWIIELSVLHTMTHATGSVQIRIGKDGVEVESPRYSRLPRLAARFGRVAACSAYVAGVRREYLALSSARIQLIHRAK